MNRSEYDFGAGGLIAWDLVHDSLLMLLTYERSSASTDDSDSKLCFLFVACYTHTMRVFPLNDQVFVPWAASKEYWS
jgi:hypothetical protein